MELKVLIQFLYCLVLLGLTFFGCFRVEVTSRFISKSRVSSCIYLPVQTKPKPDPSVKLGNPANQVPTLVNEMKYHRYSCAKQWAFITTDFLKV